MNNNFRKYNKLINISINFRILCLINYYFNTSLFCGFPYQIGIISDKYNNMWSVGF